MKRRILSIVTALALCLSFCPTWAFAAETDPSLCKHHPEHIDCGYIAPSEGQPCGHAHTDDCNTIAEDGSEVLDCQHTHDSECGYIQATPGASCGYECPLCPIEALIAALPRALTEANRAEVEAQLQEILDLWRELSEDEQEQIDFSHCLDLQDQLNVNIPSLIEEAVVYLTCDADGKNWTTPSCDTYTEVTSATTLWNGGWYVVSGSVTISSRITVSGNVHLILTDGCTLIAEAGITVTDNNSLTVYAQSESDSMGKLTAAVNTSGDAGIGGDWGKSGGTITINGGAVTATGGTNAAGIGGGINGSGGTITINGGAVTATGVTSAAGIGGGYNRSGGTITINGGTVTATGGTDAAGIGGGYSGSGGSVTITSGTVTATGGYYGAGIGGGRSGSGGEVTIKGGEVKADGGNSGAGIGGGYSGSGGTITINGGEVEANGGNSGAGIGGGYSGSGDSVTITSGTVKATGGNSGAGIGGGEEGSGGTITINGGEVEANGGNSGAGIGGGSNTFGGSGSGGSVTINDGTVTATGGIRAAGIGGGEGGSGGSVTITSGTVTATGGYYGAGIGGGRSGSGGEVTIKGGEVKADGGESGAGIGGGRSGSGGTITINGGEVEANGGNSGAGIGGGYSGSGDSVTITSGTVKATGGNSGAGIGGGEEGSGGTITINGGEVEANGGNSGAGIGGGHSFGDAKLSTGTVEITDGTVTVTGDGISMGIGGTGSISGGTVTAKAEGKDSVSDDIAITGGTVNDKTYYTVTFNTMEHDSTEVAPQIVIGGQTAAAPAVKLPGYVVAGWYADEAYTALFDIKNTQITGNTTLYAKWEECTHLGNEGTSNTNGTHNVSDCRYCGYSGVVKCGYRFSENVGTCTDCGDALTVSVSGTAEDLIYSGSAKMPVTVTRGGTPLTEGFTVDYTSNINVGDASFTVTIGENQGTYPGTFSIGKATPTITWETETQTLTYTGQAAEISAKVELVNNENYTGEISYSYAVQGSDNYTSGLPINAGTYTIKASIAENGNYTDATTETLLTLNINKSTPEIAFVSGYTLDKTYDGQTIANPTASNLDLTGAEFKDVEFAWTQDGSAAVPKNAGTYTLTATIPETTNTSKAEATLTVTISPKAVTADSSNITLIPSEYEFNGTAREPAVVIKDGTFTIPAVEYTVGYSNNVNVGEATVTITDNDGGNYTVNGSTTFQITKRSLGNAVVTVNSTYTYDGTAQVPAAEKVKVTLNGTEIPSDQYTISAIDNINAGEATVTITATENGDYSGSASGKFNIEQASLTIKASDQTITYGGSITQGTDQVTVATLCGSDALESVTLAASTKNVPGGTITPSNAVIKNSGEDVTGNYSISYETGSLTINRSTPTISFVNGYTLDKSYDGQTIANPTASNLDLTGAEFKDVEFVWTQDGSAAVPKNAGIYTLTATIPETTNTAKAEAILTVTISKATLTVTGAEIATRPYKADDTSATVNSVAFSGLVNGEELTKGTDYTATGEFADANAGENKSVTVTVTLSAESTTAKNYELSGGTCTATGKIEKADTTITTAPTATGITYGQALSGSTLSGGAGSVPGTFAWTSSSEKPSAGTAQCEVTFTPTDEANYNTATANVSVTVAKATPTITWSGAAQTVDYTGSAAAITAPTVTLVNGETFSGTISYSYSAGDSSSYTPGLPTNAGIYKVKANIAEQSNYIAAESGEMTLTISKVNYTGMKTASTSAKFGLTKTYDLKDLLPAGYELGTVTVSDSNSIFDGTPSVSGTTLTYKLVDDKNNVDKTGDIIIPVTSSTNYNAFDLTITVTVTNVQVPDLKVNPISVTYTGSPVPDSRISGTATVDGQPISGTWRFVSGQNLTDVADSGTKQVIFTPGNTDLYGPNTGTVTVTISKATPSLSLTASPTTLPNGGTVTLTLAGLPADGSATVTCSDASISVTKGSGDTWTADLPAGGASYTFTASYAGDGNHNSATANCTVSVEKITPKLSLTAAPTSLTGSGKVTLTLTDLPSGGTATVTCTGGITVTEGADNTWTATLPNSTKTYTFTASYAGNDSYHAASASCTVTVKEVVILPDPPADDDDTKFQLVMETEISEVPEGLKGVEGLETPEKLVIAMKTAITEANSGVSQANIAVYDVELMVSTDGGSTWTSATKENFPSSGLVITLPYPDGTNSSYQFTVVHMFTSGDFGHNPGETETPAVTNTADGIRFTVTGLSPISVGWVQTSTPSAPTGPSISSPGSGVTTYAITVEKSEHGKVTSNRINASSNSTVTLTVTPDSGYVLDTLTVTDSRGNEIKLTTQGGGKYTFTMPARAVTVKATFAPLPADVEQPCDGGAACPSHGFTDLGTVGTWYHEAVDYVLRNGLMNGYSSTMFGPNDNLSRAQLAQILYNKEGKPLVTSGSVFTDVADGQWYAPAITWAAANGIVGGYGNGRFGPDDNITREQLAVMLWRYAGSPAATDKELHFTDADKASGYALEALRWAAENGILNGYGDGRLNPGGLATRAQVAQMLMNFLKNE